MSGVSDSASAWRRALREHLGLLRADATTWFVFVAAAVTLTASEYHATTGEYLEHFGRYASRGGLLAVGAARLHWWQVAHWLAIATGHTADFLYWLLASLLLYMALPLAIAAFLPKVRVRDFGLGVGDWRYGLQAFAVLYAIMLPFVVVASRSPVFAGQYPMAPGANSSWSAFFVFELCYAAYFAGWEFMYRGMLVNGLYPRFGVAAILLPAIPFAIMHAGKPEPEAYGAIVAGVALGVVAVRARSFWYGALLHAAVAITMDVLCLSRLHRWPRF